MKEKWTPFERGVLPPPNPALFTSPEAKDMIMDICKNDIIYVNSIYQVNCRRVKAEEGTDWPCDMVHLSIKRRDKEACRDWRDFQRIKNELVGENHEAIEIFPAEQDLIDTANQYHLWVFIDPKVRLPIGWHGTRAVSEECRNGSKQRPWPQDNKPRDLRTIASFIQSLAETDRK